MYSNARDSRYLLSTVSYRIYIMAGTRCSWRVSVFIALLSEYLSRWERRNTYIPMYIYIYSNAVAAPPPTATTIMGMDWICTVKIMECYWFFMDGWLLRKSRARQKIGERRRARRNIHAKSRVAHSRACNGAVTIISSLLLPLLFVRFAVE